MKKDAIVPYSYLKEQFKNPKSLLKGIEKIVKEGDFTLGKRVELFEKKFASFSQIKYAVGVGSGTAALHLALEALEINGEVITTPNTFFATVNAIVAAGAKPVFVDVGEDYNINPNLIERTITPRTQAIMPVHLTGRPADIRSIRDIAYKHGLAVIEDAAQAIGAYTLGMHVGYFSNAAGFSFHPLKNLNVWGDAGMVATKDDNVYQRLLKLRNQGLSDRDNWAMYGHNHRIDPIQAYIGSELISHTSQHTKKRISNARYYDHYLQNISFITIPKRINCVKEVFHTYTIQADKRDELQSYLLKNGIETKIHYPIPLHLQPATRNLGYKVGDFPVAEEQAKKIISIPVHSYLTENQREYVVKKIKDFYSKA